MNSIALLLVFWIGQNPVLDIQGHRGARGLLPENSISGFLKAIDYKVNTVEMDVVITSDNQVVVSHEPFMNKLICSAPESMDISDIISVNVYRMTYEEVATFDCGQLGNPAFPTQKPEEMTKPLLRDVINAVESKIEFGSLYPVRYNIEIKSWQNMDKIFHPVPSEFSDLVYKEISNWLDWERVTIQSFDYRVLRYFHDRYPEVELVQLVEQTNDHMLEIDKLGFNPEIYSCYFELLSDSVVKDIQSRGIKVIPWTVNEAEKMKQLASWGVDGIITDYPNIAAELFK